MRYAGRLLPFVLVAAALAIWEAIVDLEHVPSYLVPGPRAIAQAAIDDRDLLWSNTLPTLKIALFGFALALVSGLAIAILIHRFRLAEMALYPLVVASQTIPLPALAPVLVVILGFSIFPKLIVVALFCFFPITVNAVDGLKSVDPDLRRLMRSLGASRLKTFRTVEWPSALPSIFSGAKVAITYSVIGDFIAEYVGSFEGLGHLITEFQSQFDTEALFAVIAMLAILGLLLFAIVSIAERLLLPWYHEGRRAVDRR